MTTPALLLTNGTESATISSPVIPYTVTVNRKDTTSERYAVGNNQSLDVIVQPETESWMISADDCPIFTNDNQLVEFADA